MMIAGASVNSREVYGNEFDFSQTRCRPSAVLQASGFDSSESSFNGLPIRSGWTYDSTIDHTAALSLLPRSRRF